MIGKIDDRRGVGQRRVAEPDPDELVLLDQRIALDRGLARNEALARHLHAFALRVDDQTVIAALDAVLDDRAEAQRRGAVAAAVGQRGGAAVAVAEQHDRVVADAAGERRFAELVTPCGDVPGIAREHRLPPSRSAAW